MSAALNLSLSGATFTYCGFFHTGGRPIAKGWWEYKDGSEGGELWIDTKRRCVDDFDGACDLPGYVKKELENLGIDASEEA